MAAIRMAATAVAGPFGERPGTGRRTEARGPRRLRRPRRWPALALLGTFLFPSTVAAHEVRPAYLQVTEVSAGRFEVLWKQPILPDTDPGLVLRLPIAPRFPVHCRKSDRALPDLTASALIERWTLTCDETGLMGAEISVDGLPRTLTDVLLRVRLLDGTSVDHLLRSEAPRVVLSSGSGGGAAVPAYLLLGIEHLLFGFDHILFVVGLLFFVHRPLQLVQVVTAFTAAHSVTLALSSLGVVTLSQRAVEAAIALSILFLAVELARGARSEQSVMARSPWAIAFGFGLLHGFGFAGALAEIGLPESARAMALLLFNVGVEIGQLAIVGVLLALLQTVRIWRVPVPAFAAQMPIYVMGTVSAYWLVERVLSMVPAVP
ncbi:MAG: HupE/UreJ family protein [Acidobacteria bacterium]|nr:HupE/UreJ family protein [Acidobacteriota bacterium]